MFVFLTSFIRSFADGHTDRFRLFAAVSAVNMDAQVSGGLWPSLGVHTGVALLCSTLAF